MLTPGRLVAATLVAVLVSGCSLDSIWNDGPAPPVSTAEVKETATATATPSEEAEEDTYTGALAKGTTCTRASKGLLDELEDVGGVGAAVTYPHGVYVKSDNGWWTIAVATAVHANNSGYTRDNVPATAYFAVVADEPRAGADSDRIVLGDSPASKKALACLKRLPPVKPDPKPASPADTYNGKPAGGATCRAVPAKLLARMQEVGQVGGAITYPRGQMVRANRTWWTVAVATQVNPNSLGHTSDNVPAVAYFVTNEPSKGTSVSARLSFPIKGKDRASGKAAACLK